MLPEIPWQTTVLHERAGDEVLELYALENFEAATADVYRTWRGGSTRLRQDLCPMFGVIWPACRALVDWLAERPLEGVGMLELGCGLALPSLLAAKRGARVVATDQHPYTQSFLAENERRNGVRVAFESFDWRDEVPPDQVPEAGFELVVASDILFAIELPLLVAQTFHRFMAPGGTGVLTDPGRTYLQDFEDACVSLGMQVEVDVVSIEREALYDEVFLIQLSKSAT